MQHGRIRQKVGEMNTRICPNYLNVWWLYFYTIHCLRHDGNINDRKNKWRNCSDLCALQTKSRCKRRAVKRNYAHKSRRNWLLELKWRVASRSRTAKIFRNHFCGQRGALLKNAHRSRYDSENWLNSFSKSLLPSRWGSPANNTSVDSALRHRRGIHGEAVFSVCNLAPWFSTS